MAMTLDGSNGVTFNDSSLQGAAASPYVLKNRIINGDMRIDQRNAGASVTPANDSYTLDRWKCYQTTASKFSVQQNAGSVTPPAGYNYYLGITSLSAYTVLSSDYYTLQQVIEGFNCADLAWGTANAKTITISFWVRSSLTGTFGGALFNDAGNRSYPFTYTISSANTWEQKTVTIAGDTSGTWLTTNGAGIGVNFAVGIGSNFLATANTWASSFKMSATGQTNLYATSAATLQFTGVQLEVGSTATPFERRMYGQELALCQRYFQKVTDIAVRVFGQPTNGFRLPNYYKVTMRANPTVTLSGSGLSTTSVYGQTPDQFSYSNNDGSCDMYFSFTASAEL